MTDLSVIENLSQRMSIELAENICGKLSHTSKMPCPSYSLPTARCTTGAKLAKVANSVCSKCYAKRGHYPFQGERQENRWQSLSHPRWVEAISFLIQAEGNAYFRWHDSGDLAGYWHLQKIIDVANRLPHVMFWLPTTERDIVNEYQMLRGDFPPNLIVRVSTSLIDSNPRVDQSHTSSVHRHKAPHGFECRAHYQQNKCMGCRACWDKKIKNVSYRYH